MTVAYQGVPGAFGHAACLQFVPDHEPIAKPSFVAVLAAVASGESKYGVLPVENSAAGPVYDATDLLSGCRIPFVMRDMSVRMHLLARPGTALSDVRLVISHPVGLAQCRNSLRELGVATEAGANTAMAAKALSESGDASTAVLASEAAAKTYGLEILRSDMQDRTDNITTFCVLGPR
ncbi:MAG TPA: prephenate dehydratase domain-containing protein [Sphingomonadaceae bacterium]|nr:prephenate dehydratase domain-containing protein [Sphingomonadaceae bacterium]